MLEREALKDFQRRLADRLQAAPAGGTQADWLGVEAGGARYLLPLALAGEIFPAVTAQPVPYTQPWFLGVANLRGSLYGVVDLATFLASVNAQAIGGHASARPVQTPGSESQFIALSAHLEVQCALRVDRLSGLRGLDAFIESASVGADSPKWLGTRYTDASGTVWQEINLVLLAQQPEFLAITI